MVIVVVDEEEREGYYSALLYPIKVEQKCGS
jgi:hypothetical protein